VAKLFADSCCVTITSFISPYRKDRAIARKLHDEGEPGLGFVEVWVDCPISVAEQRDPKGLYQKARAGQIKDFTGISAPYEEPEKPEIHIRSDKQSVEESVKTIVEFLVEKGYLTANART